MILRPITWSSKMSRTHYVTSIDTSIELGLPCRRAQPPGTHCRGCIGNCRTRRFLKSIPVDPGHKSVGHLGSYEDDGVVKVEEEGSVGIFGEDGMVVNEARRSRIESILLFMVA